MNIQCSHQGGQGAEHSQPCLQGLSGSEVHIGKEQRWEWETCLVSLLGHVQPQIRGLLLSGGFQLIVCTQDHAAVF